MDERIRKYLDDLGRNLADLPEGERKEALNYHEEYINDALDEGVSADELLTRLDPPEKIAAMIRAETSIKRVHSNPGLKNYSKLVKYARIGITRPLSILMFSLLIFTTYSTALILFLGTVVSAAGACLVLSVVVSEALKIPTAYMGEIIGTIGLGVFSAGILMLTGYGLFVLCRPLIRLSANLVVKMMKKSSKPMNDFTEGKQDNNGDNGKAKRAHKPLRAGLIIIAAGLVISLASGLPVKLFMIFNSMKPVDIVIQEQDFSISDVSKISIGTAHTNIRLTEGDSDNIELKYEKSDWLDYDINCSDGELVFSEKSIGRLPLFSLISLHENIAELTISLPAGYRPDGIGLKSKGGSIYIDNAACPVDATTFTGSIYLDVLAEGNTNSMPVTVSAKSATGTIQSGGENIGVHTQYGTEYELMTDKAVEIRLISERGNIFIE